MINTTKDTAVNFVGHKHLHQIFQIFKSCWKELLKTTTSVNQSSSQGIESVCTKCYDNSVSNKKKRENYPNKQCFHL